MLHNAFLFEKEQLIAFQYIFQHIFTGNRRAFRNHFYISFCFIPASSPTEKLCDSLYSIPPNNIILAVFYDRIE